MLCVQISNSNLRCTVMWSPRSYPSVSRGILMVVRAGVLRLDWITSMLMHNMHIVSLPWAAWCPGCLDHLYCPLLPGPLDVGEPIEFFSSTLKQIQTSSVFIHLEISFIFPSRSGLPDRFGTTSPDLAENTDALSVQHMAGYVWRGYPKAN